MVAAWLGLYLAYESQPLPLMIPIVAVVLITLVFFFPIGIRKPVPCAKVTERVDERDVMFAREEYEAGTDKYEQYYRMRPEFKQVDDRLRKLPPLLHPGGRYYDASRSESIRDTFRTISRMTVQVDGPCAAQSAIVDPDAMTARIKNTVLELGADDVGIGPLNPQFVYSHVGRGPEPWGRPIVNTHKYAIAFAVEMDYDAVETAPKLPTVEESAAKYLKAAKISIELAERIRAMGYPARAHISDSNYQIMLPPVAADAGLGEVGRIGYLIHPRLGARLRLGAVTTDLPLVPDKPISFGVQDFCEICKKCATNCPSAAIPKGDRTVQRGVEKWPLAVEQCVYYWRVVGTDCGLCMKVCPYSHPPTFVHNLVRAGIKRSRIAQRLSIWGDDVFYGWKITRDTI
ncbi:MAG: reductive dehalogenase [candidate division Zixibacteria bacterium]|nr:reductive dehalogenase [candidate division Zixibacteria bacterium]